MCDFSEIWCIMSPQSALSILEFRENRLIERHIYYGGGGRVNKTLSLLCTCVRQTISARNAVEHF